MNSSSRKKDQQKDTKQEAKFIVERKSPESGVYTNTKQDIISTRRSQTQSLYYTKQSDKLMWQNSGQFLQIAGVNSSPKSYDLTLDKVEPGSNVIAFEIQVHCPYFVPISMKREKDGDGTPSGCRGQQLHQAASRV